MKAGNDTKTGDMLEGSCDLAGPLPWDYNPNAPRAVRWRAKNGLAALTVNIPADVLAGLNEYLERVNAGKPREKRKSKNEVIAKLIKTQLLRPR